MPCLFLVANVGWAQEKTADQYTMAEKVEMGAAYHGEHAEAVKPYTVIGNVHSVGSKNVGIYLISDDDGHILIDTGVSEMHQQIIDNVSQLGFNINDIEILLSTHAHFDHVQGHEAMRKATGAAVMAVGLDAEALSLGQDISPLGAEGWESVQGVIPLAHGDSVTHGDITLTAHQIPGHTQGCTVWTVPVIDQGKEVNVAIFGCRGPNSIVKVQGNVDFPDLVEQTLLGFQRLHEIKPDIYLSNHPETDNEKYGAAIMAGQQPHPMLQQQPWLEMVKDLENGFQGRLNSKTDN